MKYKDFKKKDDLNYKFRRNECIKAQDVRVMDENGVALGVMPLVDALKIARDRQLDLVEVAPKAEPPVVKIISWSKFKYEYSKKQKGKVQKGNQIKEIWLKPMIGVGDLQHKIKKIRNFLIERNKVRITVKPGRDKRLSHSYYFDVLNKVLNELSSQADVEIPPKVEGRNVYAIIKPKK